jgi:DMSO/TMAO reductase YedYZ molybdopterin-dependent catalytic subunit
LAPLVTPIAAHYTVAVDLEPPAIDGSAWRLRVGGAAAQPFELSLAELRSLLPTERLAVLSCISNTVGGPLVGNARWTGVPLRALLDRARPEATAIAIKLCGADGYTETLDLDVAAQPGVIVAYAVDGNPLPLSHGFPARLRVPNRYGVKNVKWLTDIVVTAHPRAGYWSARGWDTDTPVHTEARIDVPTHGSTVTGPIRVAGVAWAGDRGIAKVQVSADDGAVWHDTRLERQADPLSWRRWQLLLDLPPGPTPLTVRATDGSGAVQMSKRTPPHPAGATGYHRIVVRVRP